MHTIVHICIGAMFWEPYLPIDTIKLYFTSKF